MILDKWVSLQNVLRLFGGCFLWLHFKIFPFIVGDLYAKINSQRGMLFREEEVRSLWILVYNNTQS